MSTVFTGRTPCPPAHTPVRLIMQILELYTCILMCSCYFLYYFALFILMQECPSTFHRNTLIQCANEALQCEKKQWSSEQ